MIGLTLTEPDNSAVALPAAKITAATYHTSSGMVVVTHVNQFGASTTRQIYGQQATDLYNALVAIKAGTYTSTA